MREHIETTSAPAAIGPYSQAVKISSPQKMLFVSGQIALDTRTGQLAETGVTGQAELALTNLQAVIEAGGLTLDEVVKATVYLTNMDDFHAVNQVYSRFFGSSLPARAAVEVAALPKKALVEIDAFCVA